MFAGIKLSDSGSQITNRFLYVLNKNSTFSTFLQTLNNPYVPKKNYEVFEIK